MGLFRRGVDRASSRGDVGPEDEAYRGLIDNIPGGVVSYKVGGDWPFVYVGENTLRLLGYTREGFDHAFDGRFELMVSEGDRERVIDDLTQAAQLGGFHACRYHIERQDGSLAWVHDVCHFVEDERGDLVAYTVMVDITNDERRAEEYHRELAQFEAEESEDLILKSHQSLDANCVLSIEARDSSVLDELPEGATYEETAKVFSDALVSDEGQGYASKLLSRGFARLSYTAGRTGFTNEFRLEREGLATMWLRVVLRLVKHPRTEELESFCYVYDATERHIDHLIVRGMGDLSYLCVGIASVATKATVCYGNEVVSQKIGGKRACYESVLDAIVSRLDEAGRKEMCSALAFDRVLAGLRTEAGPTGTWSHVQTVHRKDGTARRVLVQFRFLDDTEENVFFAASDVTVVWMDEQRRITELDEERKAHAWTNALMQSILDTVSVSIFWKDRERRFEGANQSFLDYYGFPSLESILGKTDEDMGWHPDPGEFRDDEWRVINEGEATLRVPGVNVLHGVERHIVASKRPRYVDGKIVGLVGSFEDVTEEYEHLNEIRRLNDHLQTALDEAERANAAEQTFLSSMSHDMRTPLNGILGFADLAIASSDEERRSMYLDRIRSAGHLMLDLVNDVLDLSKIESGKMELHPSWSNSRELYGTIVESLRVSAEKRHIDLVSTISGDYPRYINVDRLHYQQVILNLLSNAVKYTPEGGSVRLDVSLVRDGDAGGAEGAGDAGGSGGAGGAGGATRVVVADTGVGMSKGFQKQMFDPFSQEYQSSTRNQESATSQVKGTGLGLSIVKRIVDLMGGTIEVKSVLGKGTTFTVTIGVEGSQSIDGGDGLAAGVEGTAQDAGERGIAGRTILLCEDNDLNAEIATVVLHENGGAEVTRAATGKEGLDVFAASEPGHFDLVLMDLRMPKMDGFEATGRIRALDRPDAQKVPIVAMTADAFDEDVQKCLDLGMAGHIGKPIDVTKLIATVASYIDGGVEER